MKIVSLEHLVETSLACISGDYSSSELLDMIEFFTPEEFRVLSEKVREKFPLVAYKASKTIFSSFLMFAFGIKENFSMDYVFEKTLKAKANCLNSLLRQALPLLPHLTRERFWKFVHYLESLDEMRPSHKAYLLNNDCVTDDQTFMLTALKAYLNNEYSGMKLRSHKLLLSETPIERLTQRQLVVLASRSVVNGKPVRFRFTPKAFETLKAKLLGLLLVKSSLIRKEEYENFIANCKVHEV